MRHFKMTILILLLKVTVTAQSFTYANNNPVELGKVNWLRNYDKALQVAENKNRPIFLLFQEVPGCGNCTKYGNDILSHPLIVEAIEDLFVPLAIYNNKQGHDKDILDHFGEPSWNNPVVRFLDNSGKIEGDRIANFRSRALLVQSMIDALEKNKIRVPGYLINLEKEFASEENGTEEFYLSMYCFWTGEKEIVGINGVVGTEAGFMHGREVVKVEYDSKLTGANRIAAKAGKVHCADEIFTNDPIKSKLPMQKIGKYRKDRQDKYYLLNSRYRSIPMTEYQKSLVNSELGSGRYPEHLLSPRQLSLLEKKRNFVSYVDKNFRESWYELFGG